MRRTFVLSLFLTIAMAPLPSMAQAKRAMTIDDLITAIRVADPQLSPDGKRVIFTRTTTVGDSGRRNSDIWVVPSDASAPAHQFIVGDKSENTARFTPDGKRIVFMSTRDGAPQVYLADAEGNGAKQITRLSGGVQPPLVVSPDSKKIAYVSDVYPQCKDEECNRRMRDASEKDPVKVRVLTALPFRHWDEWRIEVRHHIFVTDIENGETRDITPGDFDSPPHFYEDAGITFSADSRSVAFVSNRDGKDKEMMNTNQDVWMVPISGGEPKKITTNHAADQAPTFSPDGQLLAIKSQRRAGFE